MVKRGVGSGRAGLSPYAFGNAFGLVSVIALAFYAVLYWFIGYDPSIILEQFPITFDFDTWTIVVGAIQTYVLGYVAGWIFVKIYNASLRS